MGNFAITKCEFHWGGNLVGRVLALKIWGAEFNFKNACFKKAICGCTRHPGVGEAVRFVGHWTANQTYLVSSKPVRDPVLKTNK